MKLFFLQRSWWVDIGDGLLEFLLAFGPSIVIAYGVYLYALEEAKPRTPPPGYVFPRLPVIEGEFSVGKYVARASVSNFAGGILFSCRDPSYYVESFFYSLNNDFDECIYRNKELYGKDIRVEQISYPINGGKNNVAYTIRISHDGRDYWHKTDEDIRQLWIKATDRSALSGAWHVLLISAIPALFLREFLQKIRSKK